MKKIIFILVIVLAILIFVQVRQAKYSRNQRAYLNTNDIVGATDLPGSI